MTTRVVKRINSDARVGRSMHVDRNIRVCDRCGGNRTVQMKNIETCKVDGLGLFDLCSRCRLFLVNRGYRVEPLPESHI